MIKVKLHFIGVKKGLYNSVDKLSPVIVAPKGTILNNPEEVMFKRTGEATYHEIEQYQKDFIRQWCAVNRTAGSDLTLTQVDKIIKLADYAERKAKELAGKNPFPREVIGEQRSAGEGEANGKAKEDLPDDGSTPA